MVKFSFFTESAHLKASGSTKSTIPYFVHSDLVRTLVNAMRLILEWLR